MELYGLWVLISLKMRKTLYITRGLIKNMRRRRRKNFNLSYIVIILVLVAVVFSFINGDLTGWATSGDFDMNLTIGNSAPTIINVTHWTSGGDNQSYDIIENGSYQLNFTFLAQDTDLATNLDDSTATVVLNRSSITHTNSSCKDEGNYNTTVQNYSCYILVWWWEVGNYTINASIQDLASAYGSDSSKQAQLNQTTAITFGPANLTWPAIGLTDANKTPTNDPIEINNTGNANFTDVNITAIALVGESTSTTYINSSNFTASTNWGGSPLTECAGTNMVNATTTQVAHTVDANVTVGNFTAPANDNVTGQENIFICLTDIPSSATSQSYSTFDGGAWTLLVAV